MTIQNQLQGSLLSVALATAVLASPAWAISGAEVLKLLNHDDDQTLEIPEVIHAASKVFTEINPDGDTTLERLETAGRLSESGWKGANLDGDDTLEMDEWLSITRRRFAEADDNKDDRLTAQELESPAGQSLVKMIMK